MYFFCFHNSTTTGTGSGTGGTSGTSGTGGTGGTSGTGGTGTSVTCTTIADCTGTDVCSTTNKCVPAPTDCTGLEATTTNNVFITADPSSLKKSGWSVAGFDAYCVAGYGGDPSAAVCNAVDQPYTVTGS